MSPIMTANSHELTPSYTDPGNYCVNNAVLTSRDGNENKANFPAIPRFAEDDTVFNPAR